MTTEDRLTDLEKKVWELQEAVKGVCTIMGIKPSKTITIEDFGNADHSPLPVTEVPE